jgi:hypothetical protein
VIDMRGVPKWAKPKVRRESPFHPAGTPLLLSVIAGAVIGFGSAFLIHTVIAGHPWIGLSADEPVFAVFMSATVAGGVAAFSLRNLAYKNSESLRGRQAMFDEQFHRAAAMLAGTAELEIVAGAALMGSLLRTSSAHAQVCADLFCEVLRRESMRDFDDQMRNRTGDGVDEAWDKSNRILNAIAAAIAAAIRIDQAPPHISSIRWRFHHSEFGNDADFTGCAFGPGTGFEHCGFRDAARFAGATFADTVLFDRVEAHAGLVLVRAKVEGGIDVFHSELGRLGFEGSRGLMADRIECHGLRIEDVKSSGPLKFDDAVVAGEVQIANSKFTFVGSDGAKCGGRFELHKVQTLRDVWLQKMAVTKSLTIESCEGPRLYTKSVTVQGKSTIGPNKFVEELHE